MKVILYICRILVGSTFLVSGLIKANDPLGFSYKLEEYFAESALNMPYLEPYALALAILACMGEVILGYAVLFGGKIKVASWALLILTLFFGWLTAYTATCDPNGTYEAMVAGELVEKRVTCVTDCGCFGDAMKGSLGRSLTPWESFWKDLILLLFLLPVFYMRNKIKFNDYKDDKFVLLGAIVVVGFYCWVFNWWFPITALSIGILVHMAVRMFIGERPWLLAGIIALLTGGFVWYVLNYLPVRDYRPFAVGKSIPEQMTLPPDAKQDVYETVLTYRNSETGEVKDFNQQNYPWDDSTWTWVNTESQLIEKGDEAPIHDFSILDADGNDLTADFMEDEGYLFVIISKNADKFNPNATKKINQLVKQVFDKGYYAIGLTASTYDATENLRHDQQLMFDFYYGDETTLKTIVRANPGILLLKKGMILGKWSFKSLPAFEEIEAEIINEKGER